LAPRPWADMGKEDDEGVGRSARGKVMKRFGLKGVACIRKDYRGRKKSKESERGEKGGLLVPKRRRVCEEPTRGTGQDRKVGSGDWGGGVKYVSEKVSILRQGENFVRGGRS